MSTKRSPSIVVAALAVAVALALTPGDLKARQTPLLAAVANELLSRLNLAPTEPVRVMLQGDVRRADRGRAPSWVACSPHVGSVCRRLG
jgi:hypothetical protein